MSDFIPSDATIKPIADLAGTLLVLSLFSSNHPNVRRLGAFLLIMSGVDGVMKMRFLLTASTYQLAYQVPWIFLGVIAVRWLFNPPQIEAR